MAGTRIPVWVVFCHIVARLNSDALLSVKWLKGKNSEKEVRER